MSVATKKKDRRFKANKYVVTETKETVRERYQRQREAAVLTRKSLDAMGVLEMHCDFSGRDMYRLDVGKPWHDVRVNRPLAGLLDRIAMREHSSGTTKFRVRYVNDVGEDTLDEHGMNGIPFVTNGWMPVVGGGFIETAIGRLMDSNGQILYRTNDYYFPQFRILYDESCEYKYVFQVRHERPHVAYDHNSVFETHARFKSSGKIRYYLTQSLRVPFQTEVWKAVRSATESRVKSNIYFDQSVTRPDHISYVECSGNQG